MGEIDDEAFEPVERSAGCEQALTRSDCSVVCVAQAVRMCDHRARIGDAVAEGVFGGAHYESRRQSGEHRDVTEGVARGEYIDRAATVQDFDSTGPDDVEMFERRYILGDDDVAAAEEFHLHRACELVEIVTVEQVVRCLRAEEVDEFLHRRALRDGRCLMISPGAAVAPLDVKRPRSALLGSAEMLRELPRQIDNLVLGSRLVRLRCVHPRGHRRNA